MSSKKYRDQGLTKKLVVMVTDSMIQSLEAMASLDRVRNPGAMTNRSDVVRRILSESIASSPSAQKLLGLSSEFDDSSLSDLVSPMITPTPLPDGVTEIIQGGLWPYRRAGHKAYPPPRPPEPDLDERQVVACLKWLLLFAEPVPRIARIHSSYGCKHYVERWSREGQKDGLYIANGAFIEAARRLGYRLEPTERGSPNAYFNLRIHSGPEARRNRGY